MTRLEHANLTVPDIDEALRFFAIVAPDFEVRRDEAPDGSYRWAHVGNDQVYFALQAPHLDTNPEAPKQPYENYGVNHLALVVEDLEAVEAKLVSSGYRRGIDTPKEKHRKRLYFYDSFGFEWELIEYLSDKPEEKFLYE